MRHPRRLVRGFARNERAKPRARFVCAQRIAKPGLTRSAQASLVTLAVVFGCHTCALAAPADVLVRIEGKSETLFEGPVLTEGHEIEASSDSQERSCDGINPNDPENTTPGPTSTASAVDAMSIIGETFDGHWYPGYDDYLITRWGPEKEAEGESWSLFVNNTLLDVGGCQYELREGAEVLWSYGVAASKPILALLPEGAQDAGTTLTATAKLNVPLGLEVVSYRPKDAKPPALPEQTGSAPYAGAAVAPVTTAANGFETVQSEAPSAVKTDAEGKATITFSSAGWHRIKATAAGVIRSNRLDVCVPREGTDTCGAPPAEDQPRSPAGEVTEEKGSPPGNPAEQPPGTGKTEKGPSSAGQHTSSSSAPSTEVEPRRLRVDGVTLLALDDRAPSLHYRGHWRREPEKGAWEGTVTRGAQGASVSVALPAGRPVFVLRDIGRGTRVEVREAGRRQIFGLKALSKGSKLLIAQPRTSRGAVELRILTGTVGLDALGTTA